MRSKFKVLVALIVVAVAGLLTTNVSAAGRAPTGLTVSPAFQQASITDGEAEHPISFTITNNQQVAQAIHLSTVDFNTLDESGGLLFVGTNPTDLQKKYGLAKWLTITQPDLIIQPKQTVEVKALIQNLTTLSAGGHYGAINISVGENQQASGNNKVGIKPVGSELLFVTKLGGDTHRLALQDVIYSHNIVSLPSSATLRFYNDGNTHITPRGKIVLSDSKGRVVSSGIINDNSGLVLPGTYRRFSVPLNPTGVQETSGRYKLTVDYRFDGFDQFRRFQASLTYLSPAAVIVGTTMIVLGAYLFYKAVLKPLRKSKPNTKKQ